MFSRIVVLLLSGLTALLLSGCESTGKAALDMARMAWQGPPQPSPAGLDPRFAYLRVSAGSSLAFLARGYVEQQVPARVEVWYSADRESLRFQDGRLIGAFGTLTEWRQVSLSGAPDWKTLLGQNRPVTWVRVRDVMPGYRFNLRETLQVRAIAPPAQTALVGLDAAKLRWFEETQLPDSVAIGDADRLKPARYALDAGGDPPVVVYGEQCLSADLCLTWQRWTAAR